jgi:hypothetical protein
MSVMPRPGSLAAAGLALALIPAVCAAGNTSGQVAGSHVSAGAGICAAALPRGALPDTLTIQRRASPIFRRRAAVRATSRGDFVLDIYSELCLLPVTDLTKEHCPPGLGIPYRLAFSRRGAPLLEVAADPSGCQAVFIGSRLGGGTAYASSAGLWALLAEVLHVRPHTRLFPR